MIHNQPDKLIKGIAYHGNRMLRHMETDLRDIVNNHFNLVVHMFSHTDWDRHRSIMKEIIQMTEGHGLDVWVDNWGLGGPPGDKSHFLAYYPDSHQVYSDGSVDPVRACLNSPNFRKFTKEWIDVVYDIGGRSIFWDEPHLAAKAIDGGKKAYTCACERCQNAFREQYGYDMPPELDENVEKFRIASVVDYFREVTAYSQQKQMENIVCVMLGSSYGINLDSIEAICSLDTLQNIGSDPYWLGQKNVHPYDFVYESTKRNLDVCKKFGKQHNIWIQGYATPAGREEEIIWATDAAYDAGARQILVWGFRGSESNDYRAKSPDMAWKAIGEGMRRITDRHHDEIRRSRLEKLNPGK
ncbi:hypothetical protein [Paenibacillus ginsengarvi]|uniref:Uncharacterized protein n=1 Tax=Paenibacillus ginsengarvi TaxID=400777 RepID=A0A3B0CHP5_9BACL|nr:hypothetical protein [Paenibacillus ginsengarvi]RKN84258.1 hypothetical protein D7M11_14770 [Paenibacillus ginsengarvi]